MSTKISAVYKIENTKTGKVYIGQTTHVKRRFTYHKSRLRANLHSNPLLQDSWNKYGENTFLFEIIEECSEAVLLDREQYWADQHKDNRYNIGDYMYSAMKGKEVSEEVREKLSISTKKSWKNPNYVEKMKTRKGMTGKQHTEESKKKMAAAMKVIASNLWKDPEYMEKMANRPKPSEETKRKISENSRMRDPIARLEHSKKMKALRYTATCTVCNSQYVCKSLNSRTCSHPCKLFVKRARAKELREGKNPS